ncbi:sensor histidine kinase [Actinokineospora bangkokensis]|uniref:histidine kinase n=1 Tax=Actinokineospora bangkokensis TaxID=1193682 RepID=A0A1Q9LMA7_9PSEU|nr:histidine kinase [Actinokineospora bangkokensis]OLR93177.1 hypothetical protein BJP25_16900 [Actinokineospora bangkokensis]
MVALARSRDRRALLAAAASWVSASALVLAGAPIGPLPLPWWWRVTLIVPLAAAILLVRVLPVASLVAVAALSLLDAWFLAPLLVLSYVVGRGDARERRVVTAFGAVLLSGVVALRLLPGVVPQVVVLLAVPVVPWLLGRHQRVQRDLAAAGWLRAREVERRQREVAERARVRERWRIARDMHDRLGHDLSLLALRVGVLEVAGEGDERVRRLAGELREVAQGAVERLHEVIGVLRAPADEPDATPEDVPAMVDAVRAAGMDVVFAVDGRVDLPEDGERALRLVVREALTNAAKHAPGSSVHVQLRGTAGAVEVAVRTSAPPVPVTSAPGNGSGLVALTDQVADFGGEVEFGPSGGGFEVRAVVPRGLPTPEPLPTGRRLVSPLFVPVAGTAVLLGAMMVYFADATEDAVMAPDVYQGLRLGQTRDEIAGLLPEQQVAVTVGSPPAGVVCEHYRTRNGDLFESDIPVYQLCFTQGRLTAKDDVQARSG